MEHIFQDPTAQERCNLSLLIQGNLVWLRQHPSKGQSHGGRRRKTPGGNQKEFWARRGLWWQRCWVLSPSHLLSLSSACKGITGHSGLWSQLSKVPCCCFWVTWGTAGPCPWRSEDFAELSFPAQTHGCITTHPGTPGHSWHKWGEGTHPQPIMYCTVGLMSSWEGTALLCHATECWRQEPGDSIQNSPWQSSQFCKHSNALLLGDCSTRAGDCSAHP